MRNVLRLLVGLAGSALSEAKVWGNIPDITEALP